MKALKRFLGREKGVTLLELVVVLSIMAVIASIVAPAVGGKTTSGRGTVKVSDIATVQGAVDNYVGEAPALTNYPVNGNQKPSLATGNYQATITSFVMPDGATTTLYVKPIDFNSNFLKTGEGAGTTKTFVPSYLKTYPKHSGATGTTADPNVLAGSSNFTGGTISFVGGKDYTPGGTIGTIAATSIGVWVIDQNSRVWVLLDDSNY
ncbi:MAG: prepilin-type N-terminal cleavage/methylation domain-containing protein [Dehalococcoidia bacterium]|nr:prepilin-type N-terminal cleavage/methylation domain-containing protein [Dehalococcoidia bacterium]